MVARVQQDGPNEQRWPVWLLGLLVVQLGAARSELGGIGLRLATGREILRAWRVPQYNVLTYTEPERPWLVGHGLSDVVFELTFRRAGAPGLLALELLCLGGIWLLCYAAARALGTPVLLAASCCLAAATAAAVRFELGPELLSSLCTSALFWVLCHAAISDHGQFARRLQLAASAAVSIGWLLDDAALANPLLLCAFALGARLEPMRARRLGVRPAALSGLCPALQLLGCALFGTAGAALVLLGYHPHGMRALMQLAGSRTWELPAAALIAHAVWLTGSAACIWQRRRSLHPGLLACVGAQALFSLWSEHAVLGYALVSAPLVARSLRDVLTRRARMRWAAATAIAAVSCACLLGLAREPSARDSGPQALPATSLAFVRDHGLRGRAVVSEAWTSAFLGALYPEHRVFFEPRLACSGRTRQHYATILAGEPGWDALLDHYDIQFVLLQRSPSAAATGLHARLQRDERYRLVHTDAQAEIFIRSDGDNSELAPDTSGTSG